MKMAADSYMFNYTHQDSPKRGASPLKRCNGECHRNKFSAYSQDTIPEGSYNDITYIPGGTTEQARKDKIKEHAEEFIGNSTLHGFHYCFDKRFRIRRFLWSVIVLGSVFLLLQKLYESGHKFFNYPFSSTTSIVDVKEIEFPAISICNINDFRMSKMHGTKLHKLIQKQDNITHDDITGQEYASATRSANHNLQDMIWKCNFLNQPCDASNFTIFYQTQGEKCYTINSADMKTSESKIKERGMEYSFDMTINIEHYEYYEDTVDSGLRLIIHDQNETPVRFRGVTVSPGFTTYVEVSKSKTVNLKLPYKTACGLRELKYFKHYSENTCWLERLTDHVVKHCKCKDGFMPGDARVCSIKELMNCTWPKWSEFKQFKDINCPIACEVVNYKPLLSYAKFPSNKYADFIAEQLELPEGSNMERRKFVRDNYLRFVIYFESMSYTKMEQTPSYDIMIFLGDIGGQLGLFLGTSILTYIEFFDALAMIIYTKYFEIFKPRY